MMDIEFNDRELTGAIRRIEGALTDMTPLMQDVGELMVHSTKRRFIAGSAPDGSPWAPKSEVTKAAYERRGDPVDERPLFGPSGRLSGEIHYQADETSVSWGSSLIYAAVQQFGAEQGEFGPRTPWGDIPARPFLGLGEDDKAGIIETVTDWMTRTMKA